MKRLEASLLTDLVEIKRPNYSRESLRPRILHLGVGAFHRAHQAWYTEKLNSTDSEPWGILGASLRSSTASKQLTPQEGLYTLVEAQDIHRACRVIGAILGVIDASSETQPLIEAIAEPNITVITSTITEKGYLLDENPQNAIRVLAQGLALRKEKNAPPITLLSCDNLASNGKVLKNAILALANRLSLELADWIEKNVSFPSSMVDRIVPAMTESRRQALAESMGFQDEGIVFTEPFSQWIIEKSFAENFPRWDTVGALYVDNVEPFEQMKLRMLNGSHSLMAYLGLLVGVEYVDEAINNPLLNALIHYYMDELVSDTLALPVDFDIEAYKSQLIHRFENKALQHQLAQIAMDGSQKIPQRWLALIEEGANSDIIALGLAAWAIYLSGGTDKKLVPKDPILKEKGIISVDGTVQLASLFSTPPLAEFAARFPEVVLQTRGWHKRLLHGSIEEELSSVIQKAETT